MKMRFGKATPFIFVFGTLSILVLALILTLFFRTNIPEKNSYVGTQATLVTFSDGTEMGRFASENRIEVPLMRIPLLTQKAVMAAEDQSFYSHSAFSLSAILRAIINNVQGKDIQGGSTITQQYVKIAYLSQEQTLERKLKELIIAIKLENRFTKNELLNNYLNAIYFGRGAYGIETAANQYFDKSAAALTLPESIVLASVIRSPGKYDPSNDPANLRNLQVRFAGVARIMRENQWITESQYRNLQFPTILERRNLNTFLGVTGYIMEEVRKELISKGYKEDDISQGGLVITTTIDRDAQDAAEWAVAKETPRDAPEDLHVGLVAIKPGDGAILAMYGGSDYLKRQLNDATQSITQAGSTFKPFAIVAGLERGIPLSSVWDGRSPQIYYGAGAPYKVSNYGNSNFGKLPLLRATAYSVNTVFVRLAYRVGFKPIVDVAKRAGIPDAVEMLPTPSFVLGVSSPRVIDVANAFATFASEGIRSKPYLVARISKFNGEALYRVKPETSRVFDKKVMADLNYALRGVIRGGTASAALGSFPRPVAGKTGTSQNNASAWFTGYTPQLSASVALFRDDATEELSGIGGLNSVTGGSFPARIWNTFARKALEEKPIKYFSNPAFIGGTKAIDLINPSPKSSPSESKKVPDKPKVPAIPRITAKPIPLPSVSAKKIP
jgi:membrane peptidoglycan carboxypeptidase